MGIGDWISNAAKFAKKAPPAVPAARMAELAKKAREAAPPPNATDWFDEQVEEWIASAPNKSGSLADKFPLLDDAPFATAPAQPVQQLTNADMDVLIKAQDDGTLPDGFLGTLSAAQAKQKAQELKEFYAVLGEPVGSVPKQADKDPEGYTLAPLDDGDEDPLDEFLGLNEQPPDDLIGGWLPVPGSGARRAAAQRAMPLAARQPAENIRDYIARLREMNKNEEYKPAVAFAVKSLEDDLQKNLSEGRVGGLETQKPYTQDYIDYLAAHGVDQRTLDDIASGALPMDPQSRMARAEQHDLDPKAIWFRWDRPLKTDMKGFTGAALAQPELRRYKSGQLGFIDLAPSKEGLVYTSHNPDFAKRGVQMPHDEVVSYPLLGPKDGIAGIDNMPPSAYDTFRSRMQSLLLRKFPDKHLYPENPGIRRAHMRSHHLAEPLVEPQYVQGPLREATLDSLRRIGPSSQAKHEAQGTIPHFSTAEDRKVYTEPLMASGAKGTLVRDETGLATAFTPAGARMLRRADLAPLDTRFKGARNLLQSLLVPAVIAGGASSLPSTDSRRTENR